ncbi:MAG TPA: trypsin-like peptidase domain-containing protein [Gemmatimonadaceae bacterium]|nr:trypsin-like peptidase domain-containing protein [Gemmatimonadaceae bacterium]
MPHLTKSRLTAIAALAFVFGVLFASSMDWTRFIHAQPSPAKAVVTTEAAQGMLLDTQNSFVGIAERVTPAVVSIDAQRDARKPDARGRTRVQVPPGFEQFFDDPQARDQEQSGSGFIVSKDGYVLTNNHVVDGADRVKVILTDRREFKATVVGRDPQTDVAVLKIDGAGLPTVALGDDSKARVGEWAVAIGNPLGLDFTVTAGIISAKGRGGSRLAGLRQSLYAIQDFIQTDAAINPGNSGGPLVNIRGEVIGINSAIASQTGFYSGYGFAIPITLAKTVMDDIIAHGHVRRGIVGVGLGEVTAEDAAVNKLKEIAGAKVGNFNPVDNNPAQKAGIVEGDLILKADGKMVDRVSTLQRIIRSHQPGDVVELEIVRYGEKKTFRVKLGEAPPDEKAVASASLKKSDDPETSGSVTVRKLGITIEPTNAPSARASSRVTSGERGVLITDVARGGPAENKLGPGMLITDVWFPEPRVPVATVADLQRALARLNVGDYVGLRVMGPPGADGSRLTSVVNLRIGN